MAIEVSDGDAIHALHHNLDAKRANGWAVLNRDEGSCAVTVNSGTLGTASETVTVEAGDALLNGENTTIAEQSVSIPTGGASPRKDVVLLSDTGEAVRSAGYPEPIRPSSGTLRTSERPAPPDMDGVACVPLAIVLVPTQATSITSTELLDIRPSGDLSVGALESRAVTANALEGEIVDAETVQSSGSGLETAYSWVEQEESNAVGDTFRAGGVLAHGRVQPSGEVTLFDSEAVRQGHLQVRGRQSETDYFIDLVLYSRGGEAMVVGKADHGDVPERSYDAVGDSALSVTFGDGGGSALNVTVDGRYGDNDPPSE